MLSAFGAEICASYSVKFNSLGLGLVWRSRPEEPFIGACNSTIAASIRLS